MNMENERLIFDDGDEENLLAEKREAQTPQEEELVEGLAEEMPKTAEEKEMDAKIKEYEFFDDSLIPADVLEAMRQKGQR